MSDNTITAVAAGVVAIVTAIGGILVNLINAKLTRVENKTEQIHVLADGNLSKVNAALAVATEKISGLEKMVAEMNAAKKDAKEAVTAVQSDLSSLASPDLMNMAGQLSALVASLTAKPSP